MTTTPPTAPPGTALRRARVAVCAVFFLNAVVYADLVPRLPELKERLDLSNAALGSAIAAMPAGALVAGLLAPLLIQRFTSARVASLGLVALAFAVAALPLAGSWLALAAVMLVVGAVDSVVDVAQNAHGLRVQRAYGRSILNAMHGLWSVGAVVGGLAGSLAAGLVLPLGLHLLVAAFVVSAVAVVALRFLLPGSDEADRVRDAAPVAGPGGRLRRTSARALLVVGVLGVLAACEAFVQDAGSSWSALFMRDTVGTGAAVGGLAFVALQVAMTVGRLVGDRVVDRFGQRRVVRTGGVVTAAGTLLAVGVPTVPTALAGFALAGLGVAVLVPAAMHTADELPGLPAGVGLTVVSWLLRAGFLLSPTLIGVLADATSLRLALLTVAVAGALVVVLGRALLPTAGRRAEAVDAAAGPVV